MSHLSHKASLVALSGDALDQDILCLAVRVDDAEAVKLGHALGHIQCCCKNYIVVDLQTVGKCEGCSGSVKGERSAIKSGGMDVMRIGTRHRTLLVVGSLNGDPLCRSSICLRLPRSQYSIMILTSNPRTLPLACKASAGVLA
jgi:hypothetical protein